MLSKANTCVIALMAGCFAGIQNASAGYMDTLNMTQGVTPVSREVYDLHMLILWICVIIGVVVFGAMFYSMYAHRKSKGVTPATFHESTKMEILWTVVPFVILVGMAIPATKTLVFMANTGDEDIAIKVTGHQWKWQYDYLNGEAEGISFISSLAADSRQAIYGDPASVDHYLLDVDNELVIPVNKKVRFLITASDVLHAWWVPDIGQKQDAIPGFINDMWTVVEKEGVYRGQCAELCGKDHGFMPIVVRAVSEADYAAWVASKKQVAEEIAGAVDKVWSREELYARGEAVYNTQCVGCHQPNGMGVANIFPAINGSAIATGPVGAHVDIVLNGKPGTTMNAFKDQMSDLDIASVLTYQRNAWDNKAGDMVQPAEVAGARATGN